MIKIFRTMPILFAAAALSACHHDDHKMAKAYFWSGTDKSEKQVLYIDGKHTGELPFIPGDKAEESPAFASEALMVELPTGRYDLQVKTSEGRTLSEGELWFKKSENSEQVSASWDKSGGCKVKVTYQ